MQQKMKNQSMKKVLSGLIIGLMMIIMLSSAVFANTDLNSKSDGIHVKNVPEGVATVTVDTKNGEKIVIDNSNAKGVQWKIDTRCDTDNVQKVTLNYHDGTNRELDLAYRTDSQSKSDFSGAVIGNSGNGTLDIWIQESKGEKESPEQGGLISPSGNTEEQVKPENKETAENKTDRIEAEEQKDLKAPSDEAKEQEKTKDLIVSEKEKEQALPMDKDAPVAKAGDVDTSTDKKGETSVFGNSDPNQGDVASGNMTKNADGNVTKPGMADVPQTGDNLGILLVLMLLSGGIALVSVGSALVSRKENRNQ